jgi:hypothetical protein
LTADFVLRRTVKEVKSLKTYKENEDTLRENLAKLLNTPMVFPRLSRQFDLYPGRSPARLCWKMMREWIKHLLKEVKLDKEEFCFTFDTMIVNQLERLLSNVRCHRFSGKKL